jgi:hypothetical protein
VYESKYTKVINKLRVELTRSHPKWAIDEKAIRVRMLVWFNPAILPHKALMIAEVMITGVWPSCWVVSRKSGVIFCHVNRVNPAIRLIERMTDASHPCSGTLPSFSSRATLATSLEKFVVVNSRVEAINKFDPSVCGIRYLMQASVSVVVLVEMIGMKVSMFSSIIAQTKSVFLDVMASIEVPSSSKVNERVLGLI